jgi:glutamate-1-semialdehyde 2,1-aminomutase
MEKRLSQRLFEEAQKVIPGGVNSPVRSFRGVGGEPPFIVRGRGSRVWDADNNEYIDYLASWGPLIMGHAHPSVVLAVQEAAKRGMSFGAPTPGEVELARLVCDAFPSVDMVRMVNSGTEACMSAIRVARAFTGRSKVLKFVGCYHGHSDGLLVKAGSGAATLSVPDSAGVPAGYAAETLVAEYNDLDGVRAQFEAHSEDIAAIIVEPIAANMGVVLPQDGFLQGLRDITKKYGALLILDEVITGFRVGYGGSQALYGITPDLTTMGKIIGGGMPIGAYGGRADVMEQVAPLGPAYQAGTLSGNPVAVAAGIAMLKSLQLPGIYENLEDMGSQLETILKEAAQENERPLTINRAGSLLGMFFNPGPIHNWDDVIKSDVEAYKSYFHSMMDQGIYVAPSAFEAAFVSTVHTPEDLDTTRDAARKAMAR